MSSVAVKLSLANEFDCPECGKLGFASYIQVSEKRRACPEYVTCIHCKAESITAEHPSFEITQKVEDFVWLRMAWQFDCPLCQKLSYLSFVPYKPGIESQHGDIKIEVMPFAAPNEAICQHCGTEWPATSSIK
jgi:transcription elongation factor Elf1